MGVCVGMIGAVTVTSPRIDHWKGAYNEAATRSNYYAAGLLGRNLIDLCNMRGVAGWWFTEDCDPK